MLTGKPKIFYKIMVIPWEKLFNLPVIIFIYIIGGMTMSYIYKITIMVTIFYREEISLLLNMEMKIIKLK